MAECFAESDEDRGHGGEIAQLLDALGQNVVVDGIHAKPPKQRFRKTARYH
jgi:hypothetical protein